METERKVEAEGYLLEEYNCYVAQVQLACEFTE